MPFMARIRLTVKVNFIKAVLLVMLVASQTGCATMNKVWSALGFGGSAQAESAEVLVMKGLDAYNHGKYSAAFKIFEEVKDRFPFSEHSLLAELKAADSQYYLKNYTEARTLYEEFENNHPTNEAVPYVMFQIGMSYYNQIDTIDRDPGSAMNAVQSFSRLIQTFPQSPYVAEAEARVTAAENFLASHEMYVADFYMRTKEYDQAEGRLEYLLANFPDTEVAPKAREWLAALQAGNPPKGTWRDWLPDFSIPTWKSIAAGFGAGLPGGATGGGDSEGN